MKPAGGDLLVVDLSQMDDPSTWAIKNRIDGPNQRYAVEIRAGDKPLHCPKCGREVALQFSLDGELVPQPCLLCIAENAPATDEWPVERWRRVADELPPKGAKPVLVSDSRRWAIACYYRAGKYERSGWRVAGTWLDYEAITHWMPLPPLPAKEGE